MQPFDTLCFLESSCLYQGSIPYLFIVATSHIGSAVGAIIWFPICPYICIKPLKSVPSANRTWLAAFPPSMPHRGNIGGLIDAAVFVHQTVKLAVVKHRFQVFEITAFTVRRFTVSAFDILSHFRHCPFVFRRSRNRFHGGNNL